MPQPGVVDARADYYNTQSLVPAAEQWVRLRAFHLHGGRLHRQQPAGSRIRPGRHARLPQADGRANHRRDSRRGGSAAAWRASAQRVSVGDSSSSAGSFFYIVLGARAESLGLRLSLDSVGGLLRGVRGQMLAAASAHLQAASAASTPHSTPARPSSAAAPLAFCRNGNPTGGGPLISIVYSTICNVKILSIKKLWPVP